MICFLPESDSKPPAKDNNLALTNELHAFVLPFHHRRNCIRVSMGLDNMFCVHKHSLMLEGGSRTCIWTLLAELSSHMDIDKLKVAKALPDLVLIPF